MQRAKTTATVQQVESYLPSNYTCYEENGVTIIEGEDRAGWTLDGYVIPRLLSGLIGVEKIQ